MKAMKKLIDKFVGLLLILKMLYLKHRKKCDHPTLQCKYNNLTQASVLMRSTFLSEILQPARQLSFSTQSEYTDISTVNLIENIQRSYSKLLKIYMTDPKKTLNNYQH